MTERLPRITQRGYRDARKCVLEKDFDSRTITAYHPQTKKRLDSWPMEESDLQTDMFDAPEDEESDVPV